ncbi:hypothetical protein LQW54_006155 [Pestalotiopsis sp. IQ-011]
MAEVASGVEQVENRLVEALWARLRGYLHYDQDVDDLFFSGITSLLNSTTLALAVNGEAVAQLEGGRDQFIQNAFYKFAERIVLEIPKQNCMDNSDNGINSLRLEKVIERLAYMDADSPFQCEPMPNGNLDKIIREAQDNTDNGLNGPFFQNFHIFLISCWNKLSWKVFSPPASLEAAVNTFLLCKDEGDELKREKMLKKLWPVIGLWIMEAKEFEKLTGERQIEVPPWDEGVKELKEAAEFLRGRGESDAAKAEIIDSCLGKFWSRQH